MLNFSEGGKYLRTRDNRRVRIYATDGGGFYSIHGAVASGNSYWEPMTWTENGVWREQSNLHRNDLVPYAPTEQWLIECPAGQTPIVFVPTGEVRRVIYREWFLTSDGQSLLCQNIGTGGAFPILNPVTPRRAP